MLSHPSWALAIKRLVDVFVSLGVLLLTVPILCLLALLIRATSPGPALYRGVRTGWHGEPFEILKFRTMVEGAERLGGPTTGTMDPRVTRVGRALRKTKLDELPQIINVLKGEMSLVGPRPEVREYTEQFEGDELLILEMRPGITDYSSIEFYNLDELVGAKDPDDYFRKHILPRKNELRLRYVSDWSLASDCKILARTAWVLMMAIVK